MRFVGGLSVVCRRSPKLSIAKQWTVFFAHCWAADGPPIASGFFYVNNLRVVFRSGRTLGKFPTGRILTVAEQKENKTSVWAVEAVFLRTEGGRRVRRRREFKTLSEAERYAATMAVVAKCKLQRVDLAAG